LEVGQEAPDEIELLLEPMDISAAKVFQKTLFDTGIPLTAFNVNDIQKEYDRLKKPGVLFSMKPTIMGTCYPGSI